MSGFEIAGLAIGIVSLYNACMKIGNQLESYQNYDFDSQATIAHLEALNIKLLDWADGVGIEDGNLRDPHDPRLDDPKRALVITNTLSCIKKIFDSTQNTLSSIKLPTKQSPCSTTRWILPSDNVGKIVEPPEPSTRRSRLAWSFGIKEKLNKNVRLIGDLVDVLYYVASPADNGLYQITNCGFCGIPSSTPRHNAKICSFATRRAS